jgi:hypothetical protein
MAKHADHLQRARGSSGRDSLAAIAAVAGGFRAADSRQ